MFGRKPEAGSELASRQEVQQQLARLKDDLHARLIKAIDLKALRNIGDADLRHELRRGAEELCQSYPSLLSAAERRRLIDELVDEILGYGPLESLLRDRSITDILINGPKAVYIERDGRIERSDVTFSSDEHLLSIMQRIVAKVGRRVDESSPMVDARLPDGSRVNAIVRPLALDGPLVSIRRFSCQPLGTDELIENQSISPEMMAFLAACVRGRLNVIIAGGTGSGKTTLLNLLSGFIAESERVVTIEDAAELRLAQPHVARLETRPPNLEGAGEVATRDLLRNALRMRPDRIIVGECRGGEACDMLQAMNTGHDGGMTTIHANSTSDALQRLQMLIGMSGRRLPLWHVPRLVAASIHIVVQVARLDGGVRKVVQISEVAGLKKRSVRLEDLFVFRQSGVAPSGKAEGDFEATGVTPRCLARLEARGIQLDKAMFCPPK